MDGWQGRLLARIADAAPDLHVEPHGSTVDGDVDGWSDLDLHIASGHGVALEQLVDGAPWAWQDVVADGTQRLRVVLADGRRLDALVRGARIRMPAAPVDVDARFDCALAAVRIGRGNDLIGLHLLLGVVRDALVRGMELADADDGTTHHRRGGPRDALASEAHRILAEPLTPETAAHVLAFSARVSGVPLDDSGLRAVIERGSAGG